MPVSSWKYVVRHEVHDSKFPLSCLPLAQAKHAVSPVDVCVHPKKKIKRKKNSSSESKFVKSEKEN